MEFEVFDYDEFIDLVRHNALTPDDGVGYWVINGYESLYSCFSPPPVNRLKSELKVHWYSK